MQAAPKRHKKSAAGFFSANARRKGNTKGSGSQASAPPATVLYQNGTFKTYRTGDMSLFINDIDSFFSVIKRNIFSVSEFG